MSSGPLGLWVGNLGPVCVQANVITAGPVLADL